MNYVRSIQRRLKPLATVSVCWLAVHGTALALEAETEAEGGSWFPSYCLVLLGIVLGMVGVCLTSRRRERAKPEAYEKVKLIEDGKD